MKKPRHARSALSLSLLFILFFSIPFVLSLLAGYQTVVSCVSALLLLLLNWLLYRREGRNLSELGLDFKRGRINFLFSGIIIGILFFAVLFFTRMMYGGIRVQVNKAADYLLIARGILLLLPAVLVEELIFRGYCFKKTVDAAGVPAANLAFAFLFIVWHWIALNAWGNYGMMLGLITTGFGHLLFSTALLKSGTLYYPIGIHLGNNWAAHHLFSSSTGGIDPTPSGDAFFVVSVQAGDPSQIQLITGYLITFLCFLIFTWIIWKWQRTPASPEKMTPGITRDPG